MDGLPKVPEPEGGVLAAGDDESVGGVAGGTGQLHVVPSQGMQQRLAMFYLYRYILSSLCCCCFLEK